MTLRTGKGGRYRYYTCAKQAIQGKTGCPGRSIRMDRLDGLVLEHMSGRLFAPDRLGHLLKEYLDRSADTQAERREKLRQLKVERTEIEGRLRKLLRLVETGAMEPDDPTLSERMAQIKLQRQETDERIGLLERDLNTPGFSSRLSALRGSARCCATNCPTAIRSSARPTSTFSLIGSRWMTRRYASGGRNQRWRRQHLGASPSPQTECPVLYESGVAWQRTPDEAYRAIGIRRPPHGYWMNSITQ